MNTIQILLRPTNLLVLPINYGRAIQGMIYKILEKDNPDLHDEGFRVDNYRYKLFAFSQLKGKYSIRDNSICFEGDVQLEIHYHDKSFEVSFRNYDKGFVELNGNSLEIIQLSFNQVNIKDEEIYFKLLSPCTIHKTIERKTRFYNPREDEYWNLINENIRKKYKAYYDEEGENLTFFINPKSIKKVVTKFKGTIIEGYLYEGKIKGHTRMLQFAYDVGIGARNTQGFGLFEINS